METNTHIMPPGIIYRNILLYRLAMNLLYSFSYKERFRKVTSYITGKSVNELCFGDLFIASFCKKNNICWTGFEVNKTFVRRAIRNNFRAQQIDLKNQEITLPPADTNIITGSLYHFHEQPEKILNALFTTANRIIISEPVKNISAKKNLWGRLAAKVSDAGNGPEEFRYIENDLLKTIEVSGKKFNFTTYKTEHFKKDIIIVLDKCQLPK
ncbi:MAG TPA: hypothetical protein PLI16_00210 [Bacteroidales bacterium]|nr:hypothetical protein [Bacteroidales bacterium]HOH83010.1 hypothetical protein [Bacteroidales bacterium]